MKVYFIAEVGINHAGQMEKAKRMCFKAAQAGANAVKFQKYDPIRVLGKDSPYLNDAHQLSWKELYEISGYARSLGLHFGCSVFSPHDVPIVDAISDYHKIASRMNHHQEFIARIDACKKPTYMSVQPQVDTRIPDRFKLLWCVRQYPSRKEDVLAYPYGKHFGLSSHCPDPSATLEAIKLGATVVESHVCESRDEKGCDIPASVTFEEYETIISTALAYK